MQRAKQRGIIAGIVFQVGVLDDDEIARGFLDAAPQRRAFTLVVRLKKGADAGGVLFAGRSRISREPSREPSSTQINSISMWSGQDTLDYCA